VLIVSVAGGPSGGVLLSSVTDTDGRLVDDNSLIRHRKHVEWRTEIGERFL